MSFEVYLAYVLACILITIIPGPTVTLIIANSLTHGTRAGLLNVAGTQLGLAIMLGVLLVGLSSIIATMGVWFDWVRIAGAVYLIWFGAFIPQFVDPAGNYVAQIMLLGATAMATAALTDGAYAILGGRTGRFMSQKRIRVASQLSGLFLIGGGVWLAFTRAR